MTEYTHTLAQAANYIRKKEKKDSSDCSGYDRWSGKGRGQGERREGTQLEIAVIIQVRDEEDQNSCQGWGKWKVEGSNVYLGSGARLNIRCWGKAIGRNNQVGSEASHW